MEFYKDESGHNNAAMLLSDENGGPRLQDPIVFRTEYVEAHKQSATI